MKAKPGLRTTIHHLLALSPTTRSGRFFRVLNFLIVLNGIVCIVLNSVESIAVATDGWLHSAVQISLAFFALEYVVRFVTAPDDHWAEDDQPWTARWRWATSPAGIVDLIAFAPQLVMRIVDYNSAAADLFGILWATKLAKYSSGLTVLSRVVRTERDSLTGVLIAFSIVLLVAGTLAHVIEGPGQPDAYGSVPAALWWTIVTLTTTGYGDVTPQTPLGRVLGGLVMICGISVFALLSGILATGFSEEVRRREFLRTYDLVSKVPFFHDIGASLIAEISRLLKTREIPKGQIVVRRGQPGDCMFFIVAGEVEVRVKPKPFRLEPGAFFGEIALVTGGPRTATIAAAKTTTLLVLDIADFRDLAARRPELSKAIHDEAEKRIRRSHGHGHAHAPAAVAAAAAVAEPADPAA